MLPLLIFLLACAGVYLGAIEAAFSALMRLSLRLAAERSDRPGALGTYLDDPLLLFIPVRVLLGLVTAAATALLTRVIGLGGVPRTAETRSDKCVPSRNFTRSMPSKVSVPSNPEIDPSTVGSPPAE